MAMGEQQAAGAMSAEDKKRWLKRAYKVPSQIRSLTAELETLRSTVGSIGGGSGMPSAPRYNGETGEVNKTIRMISLEEKIKKEIGGLERRWTKIHDAIGELQDVNERLVLRYWYINGMSRQEIADEMHYSVSRINQLHAAAIEHVKVK